MFHEWWWRTAVSGLGLALAGCGGGSTDAPAKAEAPAKITGGVTESALTTVTLTAEAVKRLGIETAAIEARDLLRHRTFGGEVMPAGGAQTTVTAPVAGTLDATASMVAVGATVSRGAVIARIVPLAPAERDVRIEAERAVNEAQGRHVLAVQRARRATALAADGSGSRRAAEEAQADLVVMAAALKAAQDRLGLASRGVSASGGLALVAPFTGVLRARHALPGQTVATAAPVFDLVRLDTVWIRVPVFAGDAGAIDRRASVSIVPLGAQPSVEGIRARPVAAPPSADAASAGIDLFYEAANASGTLRPGERVAVRVPLGEQRRGQVVPRAAVLHDAQGGSWIYEVQTGNAFVRRRVAVADIVGPWVVLGQGPAAGTRVVTTGAAELFGTEFGVGK